MPDNPVVRYHFGAVLAKQGNRKKAKAELAAALKISGKFQGAEKAKAILNELK